MKGKYLYLYIKMSKSNSIIICGKSFDEKEILRMPSEKYILLYNAYKHDIFNQYPNYKNTLHVMENIKLKRRLNMEYKSFLID